MSRMIFERYSEQMIRLLHKRNWDDVLELATAIHEIWSTGGQLLICGNGGSAGTPSHSAGDWSKELALPTLCHVDNISGLTAWANDTEYENVFKGQLETFLRPGDIVLGYSGSGNSANSVPDYSSIG